VLKEHEAGAKVPDLARRHGTASTPSTAGGRRSVAWGCPRRSSCASSKRREIPEYGQGTNLLSGCAESSICRWEPTAYCGRVARSCAPVGTGIAGNGPRSDRR
jgi:hypothetical protein